jgi:type I restriction enzyme R subunit
VIIDEAHRSVFQKYRAIFDYFDSFLVGLTATPRDEVDRDTYGLFDLEKGVPTDHYDLSDAVKDGYLVPVKAVSVPLKYPREGIRYDELSDDDKDRWDALEWEDGVPPPTVEAEAVNRWLFNIDTVDKVLEHLMLRGQKVAGGDRLGKTIIFAKNQAHAEFILDRFDANYPKLKGKFAQVITFQATYAQSLIDDFSQKDKAPHIAISVDMLDTGIDVPEVVNLVFFKLVRSKTKFWQMLGRGTRLCPDLFGPGQHKEFFFAFDYCQNLEFFAEDPDVTDGAVGASLGKRLFTARLELIGELEKVEEPQDPATALADADDRPYGDVRTPRELRVAVSDRLHEEVAAMNLDNFVIRPHRRLVEQFAKREAWLRVGAEERGELAHEVAGLPSELDPEGEEARRFDLLLLRLQLALLRKEPGFERMRDQVNEIAGLLQEKKAIPMVAAEMSLILDVQTEPWWESVTTPMLEQVRRRLRELVKFIDKRSREPLYTDFDDPMGEETEIVLPGMGSPSDMERFRAKTRMFLRTLDEPTNLSLRKVRTAQSLTPADLAELERLLVSAGGSPEQIAAAKTEGEGLGLFIRSLVGLEREAAKAALPAFLAQRRLTVSQIRFVDLIIDHLTEHGTMDAALLYESPFTDAAPEGPEALFASAEVAEIVAALRRVAASAAA